MFDIKFAALSSILLDKCPKNIEIKNKIKDDNMTIKGVTTKTTNGKIRKGKVYCVVPK